MGGKSKCVVCKAPAVKGSILCEEHKQAAQEQTEKLKQEYRELMVDKETGMVWGRADA
jgi:hypothetical protein